MLTGGFRTAAAMESAIQNKEVDIIGLGRPFCLYPHLAKEIAYGLRTECPIAPVKTGISQIDNLGFLDTLWHEEQLKLIAQNGHPDPSLSPWKVIGKMGLGMVGV
jgi:hypothetical protein